MSSPTRPPPVRKLVFKSELSPGDIVMLTAAVRDLHRCYPQQFQTDVRTTCADLWQHNPYLTPLDLHDPTVELVECHYPLINRSNTTPYHCLHGYIEHLNEKLGLNIRPTLFRGDIHLSAAEKHWFSQVRELTGEETPFWIIVAGGKLDYTIKWWQAARYQEVVDHFRGRIQFVQVGQPGDYHPRLSGVIDLRGRTNLRQLVRLVYHARGVVCPVTSLMHLAAAVEPGPGRPRHRPCVVIGGGREPNQWEAYPHHQFIHTNGALRCCAEGGCWRARTRPLGDGGENDRPGALCVDVVKELPRCMDMITARHVIDRIEAYFAGGMVTPLTTSEVRAARIGVRSTRRNPFDERLTLVTARSAMDTAAAQPPPPLPPFSGRGILICGGGLRYFPGAWLAVRMLRHLGCNLPIEIWHLGEAECDARMRQLTEPLGVTWVDGEKLRAQHPARRLGGWELKPYAILHSRFQEVLLLDADNLPIVNPESFFEWPEYRETGAVLWPDQHKTAASAAFWRVAGLPPREAPEVESGQLLIHKSRCWRVLQLCWWLNDHADFFYPITTGDKGTFPMAFQKLGVPFALAPPLRMTTVALAQHDFQGRRVFQHRCLDKWSLFRQNRKDPEFLMEDLCRQWLAEIRPQWDSQDQFYRFAAPAILRRHRKAAGRDERTLPADFKLVSLYDPHYRELARHTTSRMREYASRHGYGVVIHDRLLDPTRHPAWNKMAAVNRELSPAGPRWVVWVDADVVIMNFQQRLEDLVVEGRDVILGSDFNGLNSAVFLARNCDWTRRFFQAVYTLGDVGYVFDHYGPKWEQNTIKHVLLNFAGFEKHVAMLPERRMTASAGVYQDGDFVKHLGDMPMSRRLEMVKR